MRGGGGGEAAPAMGGACHGGRLGSAHGATIAAGRQRKAMPRHRPRPVGASVDGTTADSRKAYQINGIGNDWDREGAYMQKRWLEVRKR